MFSWLSKFIKNPRVIGSVAPSSPALAKLMTSGIKPEHKVLELGPGNGAITGFAVEKLACPTQLTLIEVEPALAEVCRKKFPGVLIKCNDVQDSLQNDPDRYDMILSGIPFAIMRPEKRKRVFKLVHDHLKDDGVFIMFQYSTTTLDELKNIFNKVKVEFTPWNIPPAFVYFCHKKSSAAFPQQSE